MKLLNMINLQRNFDRKKVASINVSSSFWDQVGRFFFHYAEDSLGSMEQAVLIVRQEELGFPEHR